MNITNLKKALPILLQNDIVPFIWGHQGIGKTQTIRQYTVENKIGFVHLHAATQEVGDLIGLLQKDDNGTVSHARPSWFPTEGSGIVFLDELNRAHPDVISALFSFITSKTMHTHVLPPGWKIVAAGNYDSDEYLVTNTSDAAWVSRFCHIELEPTTEEFCTFAESKGALSVADFVRENPEMLEAKNRVKVSLNIKSDRRAFLEGVGKLDKENMTEELRYELYAGLVGASSAVSYLAHLKANEKKVKLRDILSDYRTVKHKIEKYSDKKKTRFDMLNTPLEELATKLEQGVELITDANYGNLQQFLMDLPLEMLAQFVKKVSKFQFTQKGRLLMDPVLMNRVKLE